MGAPIRQPNLECVLEVEVLDHGRARQAFVVRDRRLVVGRRGRRGRTRRSGLVELSQLLVLADELRDRVVGDIDRVEAERVARCVEFVAELLLELLAVLVRLRVQLRVAAKVLQPKVLVLRARVGRRFHCDLCIRLGHDGCGGGVRARCGWHGARMGRALHSFGVRAGLATLGRPRKARTVQNLVLHLANVHTTRVGWSQRHRPYSIRT